MFEPGKKIPKKIEKKCQKIKNLFPVLFLAKTGIDRPKKKKKILVPNSIHTRPGEENSEKNSRQIQNIKKRFSSIIFSQNGTR